MDKAIRCAPSARKQFRYIRNYAPDRWPTGGDFLSSNKTTHGDIDGGPSKDALFDKATVAKFPTEVGLCLEQASG